MTREEFATLCDARDKLCAYCEADECERCIVTQLIDDACNELPEDEEESDPDDDFLSSLADEAVEKELIEIWLANLLEATKKASAEDLTKEEIVAEIEDVEGTISNEEVWALSDDIHNENIRHYTAYLEKLSELLDQKQ